MRRLFWKVGASSKLLCLTEASGPPRSVSQVASRCKRSLSATGPRVTSMRRYYFDLRNDDACTFDDVGLVLAGVEAAREAATQALAELSQGILVGARRKV